MKITSILASLCLLFIISCKDGPDRPEPMLDQEVAPLSTTTSSSVPPAPTTTATNSNVPHYKCPNNCAGSGGAAAGNCPVCGTAYVHNAEFHNQAPAAGTPPPPGTPPGAPPAPAATEPAQNANGVWHYTCAKGCAGGAGAAGNCAVCGGALTHNTQYHN